MGLGMVAGGLLRAVGDGRRAMFITLTGGAAAAVLDPILIFALDLGIDGAAVALVITRAIFALVGLRMVIGIHDMVGRIDLRCALADTRPILGIGLPSMLTQLSTPFGNAFLTGVVAAHGDAAVAGWAVVGRLTPLAFGVIFALSGAVGPILGQNRGAGLWERISRTYRDAMVFATAWVLAAWGCLWLATDTIIGGFGLRDEGAEILHAFTQFGAGAFLFTGALFVSNAAFNNLGRPALSTAFNWSRDAGAIPLLALAIGGSAGTGGAILVQAAAAVIVGTAAALYAWRFLHRCSRTEVPTVAAAVAQPAFASGRTALAAQLVGEESRPGGPSGLAERDISR
jgi:Na+-driven multidrug efflux pump